MGYVTSTSLTKPLTPHLRRAGYLFEIMNTMHYYIADTETAGLKPPALPASGIVEVAWLEVNEQLEVLDEKFYRVNPECPIDAGASNVHGVYAADVQGCAPLRDVLKLEYPATLICHNAPFDIRFLQPHLAEQVSSICTLALARRFIKTSLNHKLGTLVEHLNLPKDQAHSALGDVKMTRHLLQWLVINHNLELKDLITTEHGNKLMHHMPFGMYKGQLILSLPKSYSEWLLSKSDIPVELRKSLEHFSRIKKL